MGIFEDIRASTRAVSRQASQVRIDEGRAADLAEQLVGSFEELAALDPAHHALSTAQDTLAFVITMDAINFGSGWFPVSAAEASMLLLGLCAVPLCVRLLRLFTQRLLSGLEARSVCLTIKIVARWGSE